jgi:hypothetical protein
MLKMTVGSSETSFKLTELYESCGSAVDKATGYLLDDRGVEFESRYCQEFSLLHIVQTGCGAHPASYQMGSGAFSPGVKRPEHEVDHSPPTIAEVRKRGSIPSPYTFMT